MLSHQPEVSRLLHQEHVARLAEDAQQPVHARPLTPSRHPRTSRLAGLAHAALDLTHRRLPTRT